MNVLYMVAFFAAAVSAALILFDPYVILTSILAVVGSRIPLILFTTIVKTY